MIKQSTEIDKQSLNGIFENTASVGHHYDNKFAKAGPATEDAQLLTLDPHGLT